MLDENKIYQRVGEFVVSFQWLENRIREMGWLILDPSRKNGPPTELRNDPTVVLLTKVETLFLDALPSCRLDSEVETEFRASFAASAKRFHSVRRARNTILHSAYIELKAGREVHGLMRSNPQLILDSETGEPLFDQEMLSATSFQYELQEMAELAVFFNRCYMLLIHRLPAE
jgi:hypothetical protein